MNRSNEKRILILLICLILMLLSPILYLSYFTIFKASDVAKNPANRRPFLKENSVKRGNIYDRNHELLAYSTGKKYNYQRNYNFPVIYSHIIGYSDKVMGKAGLERSCNDYLLGNSGSKFLKTVKSITKNDNLELGDDITLTTDTDLQKYVRNTMERAYGKGACVVMNPKTGDILSLVSLPDFNSQNISVDMVKFRDENKAVLFNNATSGKYPPGSVFKIVTATALLESGVDQYYDDTGEEDIDGKKFKNVESKGYGHVGLKTAFTHSLNTYFARKSVQIGIDKMSEVAEKFMINKDVALEIPLKKSTWDYTRKGFDNTALGSAGFGHDDLLVTPLQMCLITSAIANGGIMQKPHLIKSIDRPDGRNILINYPEVLSKVTTEEIATEVRDLMVNVVNRGTGMEAYRSGIKIAGKTGTAQRNIDEEKNDAWFVGFAPYDNPKVAVAIVIPDVEDFAGKTAAPIGGDILEYAVKNLRLGDEDV